MTFISDDAFVRLVQERFGLKVDGFAGTATIAAIGVPLVPGKMPLNDEAFVRLFQQHFSLKVDGWAGPVTVARLNIIKPPIVTKADSASLPETCEVAR